MDLLTNRSMEITKLALDGLMVRQKAVSANTANVMTPGYQRKEVNFENQLKEMVEKDDIKEALKMQNSIKYNHSSIDSLTGFGQQSRTLTAQEANYLQSKIYGTFEPQVVEDTSIGDPNGGNNVDLEKEMMDMAKVGTQYSVLAMLEQRGFRSMAEVIKGQS